MAAELKKGENTGRYPGRYTDSLTAKKRMHGQLRGAVL